MNHNHNHEHKIEYAADETESIGTLLKLRTPSLVIGLVLGICISFVTSGFEKVLARDVHVAFFLPFVVYIADAIGTQTESIYSRDLKGGKHNFWKYFYKELGLGIFFGLLFGAAAGAVTLFWLGNSLLALAVSLATLIAIATAPMIALFVTQIFQNLREDPAASSGPVTTVIQDMTSVIIYGVVCSLIIL
jgi:magnesium transporter